jgi:hypothetical protein
MYRIKKLKNVQGPKGCRASERETEKKIYVISGYDHFFSDTDAKFTEQVRLIVSSGM